VDEGEGRWILLAQIESICLCKEGVGEREGGNGRERRRGKRKAQEQKRGELRSYSELLPNGKKLRNVRGGGGGEKRKGLGPLEKKKEERIARPKSRKKRGGTAAFHPCVLVGRRERNWEGKKKEVMLEELLRGREDALRLSFLAFDIQGGREDDRKGEVK